MSATFTPTSQALSQHLMHSRPIAVHRHVLIIAGTPAAGVILSQLVYWTRRGVDVKANQGWIHKSGEQWTRETGMSAKVQIKARKTLVQKGLLEERIVGIPRRMEFRLNLQRLAQMTSELLQIELDEFSMSLDLFRSESMIIKQLLGQAVNFHRVLVTLTASINDALLLSRLVHDHRSTGSRWHVRSRSAWLYELCMSRDEWETARRHLRQAGLLIERQSNFPRRVHLTLDLDGLVRALDRLSSGTLVPTSPKARLPKKVQGWQTASDQPKPKASGKSPKVAQDVSSSDLFSTGTAVESNQVVDSQAVGGFGKNWSSGFPDPKSPKPAFPKASFLKASDKESAKPPVGIAQTRPYKEINELQEQLQPEHAHVSSKGGMDVAQSRPVVGVVGTEEDWKPSFGGVARPGPGVPTHPQNQLSEEKQPVLTGGAMSEGAFSPEALAWPAIAKEQMRANMWWHLSGLSLDTAQEVLDELAWLSQKSSVRNAIGLVRKLATLAKDGQFLAEGAPTIKIERERARVLMSRTAQSAGGGPTRATPATAHARDSTESEMSPAAKAEVAAIRERLRIQRDEMRKTLGVPRAPIRRFPPGGSFGPQGSEV